MLEVDDSSYAGTGVSAGAAGAADVSQGHKILCRSTNAEEHLLLLCGQHLSTPVTTSSFISLCASRFSSPADIWDRDSELVINEVGAANSLQFNFMKILIDYNLSQVAGDAVLNLNNSST